MGSGGSLESSALEYFAETEGISLTPKFSIRVGAPGREKQYHEFDLGSETPAVLVECKSHTWTSGQNVPAAKLAIWNEAMYYFHLAPEDYRKIMFVLKHMRWGAESLAEYYLKRYSYLIPDGVELWEFDERIRSGVRLWPK